MPSTFHEVLIELFRHRPDVVTDLLADQFELKVPSWDQSRIESGEITELVPTEYRADSVFVFSDPDGPVLAVVLEVQLRRDPGKRWSWPVYLSTLRARLRCPTLLLVVSPDAGTAEWCATPIEMGHPEWALRPLVLGPDRVPVVVDVERAAETPELAVLSALAHGAGPEREQVFHALLAGLDRVDYDHRVMYAGVVLTALPAAIRKQLEVLMSTKSETYRDYLSPFVNSFVEQGRREGEIVGKATALLTILAARGVAVPDEAHTRITECTDVALLETWVRRAATVESVEELFD